MPLALVTTTSTNDNEPTSKEEGAQATPSLDETPVLFCRLTGIPVTVTNPAFGTVWVSWAAYRMFERIGIARGYFATDDVRSTKHVELITMAGLAVRVGRDKTECRNWLYVDEKEGVMFVVSAIAPIMLAVYDRHGKEVGDGGK